MQSFILIVVLFQGISSVCFGATKKFTALYDGDNRTQANLYQNNYFKYLSKSVAALIDNENIEIFYNNKLAKISGQNFKSRFGMCSEQKFNSNLSTSHCSGFLVAPDILVTAGHCIEDLYDCSQSKWVFDYEYDRVQVDGSYHTFADNIYECVDIIAQEYTFSDKDYAVVRLDRKVTGRSALKFRKEGSLTKNTSLVMIGHPRGLPKTITDNAIVTSNKEKNYFVTNLDAFQGNSGGPVFNSGTGLVEGILIRGGDDFFYDFDGDCNELFKCGVQGECPGEDVMRITSVPLKPRKLIRSRNIVVD